MKRPSPALVISIVALVFALGGTSIAAFKLKKNSVGSRQVKNNSLTGVDVNEGTFGKVPSAATADNAGFAGSAGKAGDATHAATADNADTLQGETGPFVLGSGLQFAIADELDPTPAAHDSNGIVFSGEGTLRITCSATPTLTWDDETGGPTDIWLSNPTSGGQHIPALTAGTTTLDTDMSDKTQDVEIWTGDDVLFSFRVASFYDSSGPVCEMTMFSNIEPNGTSLAAGTRAALKHPHPVSPVNGR